MTAPAGVVPLRHGWRGGAGTSAAVHALTGADEISLGARDGPRGAAWTTRVLATAVRTADGAAPGTDELRSLTVGDRNALLLAVIVATYDRCLDWVVDCPDCGAALDVTFDLAGLVAQGAAAASSGLTPSRIPTGADLAAVEDLASVPDAERVLRDRCIANWRDLDRAALAAAELALAEADPLAEIRLSLRCAACPAEVPAELDPGRALAARLTSLNDLLNDVHTLAMAYGWTESEVLSLTRPRRVRYLTLVADAVGPGAAADGGWAPAWETLR